MYFGIMQGRLTNQPKNILSRFPKKWEEEFKHLKKVKHHFIELMTEDKFNKNNPIWRVLGQKKILRMLKHQKLKYFILCDNYILHHSLKTKRTYEYYSNLLKILPKFKCKKIVVPIKKISDPKGYKDLVCFINLKH